MRTVSLAGRPASVVGLGTAPFTRDCDEADAIAVVRTALDCGVTLFDTADSYGAGRSGRAEEILGRALGRDRQHVTIVSKVGTSFAGQPESAGAAWIHRAVRGSLERLGTDVLDLYLLHVPDPSVPIEETLGALHEVVRDGLARAVGCSNLPVATLSEAAAVADRHGWPGFRCVQDEYHLLDRRAEDELLPFCASRRLPFIGYAPLADGLLTGKYPGGAAPAGGRLGGPRSTRATRLLDPARTARADRFAGICADAGLVPSTVAISWLLDRPGVTAVIPGATSPAQVRQNCAAAALRLDDGLRAAVEDATSRTGAAS